MSGASTGTSPVGDPQLARSPRSTLRKAGLTALTVVVPLVVYFVLPLDSEFGEFVAALLVIAAAASLIPISIRQAQILAWASGLFARNSSPAKGWLLRAAVAAPACSRARTAIESGTPTDLK